MSIVGYRARNRPQQAAVRGADPDTDDRAITAVDFAPLHERFGFTVDVAASHANARLPRYWTTGDDGLARSWAGERVWCNPPYSHPQIGRWVSKAWQETAAALTVMLVPANRTEQDWWQHLVEPYRDRGGALRTEFLPGRIQFLSNGQEIIGAGERTPFGCCLLIWQYDAGAVQDRPPLQRSLFDDLNDTEGAA